MNKEKSRGVFVVDLGELELPEDAVARITRSIRKSVLAEIASLDEAPPFNATMRPPREVESIAPWFERVPWDQTRGIWVEFDSSSLR